MTVSTRRHLRKTEHARIAPHALPLGLLFPPIFVAVYLLHWTLLRLPYFWDEGGYYIPAAWDFFRLGTLIPQTTMSNAHPPLPSILLAAWWKLTGFHIYSTRLFVCIVASAALLAVFRIARNGAGEAVAWATLVLTAIYPVWFAQSTLAHADIFATCFTLWALSFYLDRQGWSIAKAGRGPSATANAISTAGLFALAALSKETAIVVPAALFLYEAFLLYREARRNGRTREHLLYLAALAFPVLPLVGWYAYHHAATGFTFGNPEYLRYNATANLSAKRILLSLWHRLIHLAVHMNLFVPVLLTLCVLLLPRDGKKPFLSRDLTGAIVTVLLVHWIAFSVLGGALLTRYLLSAYPLLLLLCVAVWRQRVQAWPVVAGLSLAAFAIGCRVNPPYPFAPEDNLAYRDMIVLHQQAIGIVHSRFPSATVLSAWPLTAELQRPELGYLRTPMKTAEVANFTREEVSKAAEEPGKYDTAIVFSTKYNPPPGGLNLAEMHQGSDERYFDARRDLLPDEVARALGGSVIWQAERNGEWAAVLRIHRSYEARAVTASATERNRAAKL